MSVKHHSMQVEKLDLQLQWLLEELKTFVLSNIPGGRFIVDCKDGRVLQIEKEPVGTFYDNMLAAENALRSFRKTACPGDSLTFTQRPDDRILGRPRLIRKAVTV